MGDSDSRSVWGGDARGEVLVGGEAGNDGREGEMREVEMEAVKSTSPGTTHF